MNYIILTESELQSIIGLYQENNIVREIVDARLLKNGKYGLDAILLNSKSDELVNKLKKFTILDLTEQDFEPNKPIR
jgi:hypothetical protein